LLAFVRRQQLHSVTVAAQNLVLDIGDLVQRAVGETVAVEISADPQLWSSHLDRAQFESVIQLPSKPNPGLSRHPVG
jgi:hypothetical protein